VRPRLVHSCYIPDVAGVWHPDMHANCMCNEFTGLRYRMLRKVPEATAGGQDRIRRVFGELCRRTLPVQQLELSKVVAGYSGRWRTRYEEAQRQYERVGLTTRDARINAFVKSEKINAALKPSKPRMIWARRPVYNLVLASFLKPIEAVLYNRIKTPARFGVPPTRLSAKGLNSAQRAALVRRKFGHIPGCHVCEVDMTAFEAHHGGWFLSEEHRMYKRCNGDPTLAWLLSMQHNNIGVTQNGIRFSRKGGRASGDFNTGLGNTLAMVAMCIAAVDMLIPGYKCDLLADGDNCLFFFEPAALDRLLVGLPEAFSSFGHEAKVENVVNVIEHVRFGQCAPLQVTDKDWRMVRDPRKVLSNAFTSHRHYGELVGGRRILKSVAQCELVLGSGVPVLQPFAAAALQDLRSVRFAKSFEAENFEYAEVTRSINWQSRRSTQITSICRESFQRAFGLGVEEQLEIEKALEVKFPVEWRQPPLPRTGRDTSVLEWMQDPAFRVWSGGLPTG